MIECTYYKSFVKGVTQGFANIFIKEWGLEINNISLCMKNGERWINFPSKDYMNAEGEKKYFSLVRFPEKEMHDRFKDAVLKAIDKYCMENQPKAEEKVYVPDEEVQF